MGSPGLCHLTQGHEGDKSPCGSGTGAVLPAATSLQPVSKPVLQTAFPAAPQRQDFTRCAGEGAAWLGLPPWGTEEPVLSPGPSQSPAVGEARRKPGEGSGEGKDPGRARNCPASSSGSFFFSNTSIYLFFLFFFKAAGFYSKAPRLAKPAGCFLASPGPGLTGKGSALLALKASLFATAADVSSWPGARALKNISINYLMPPRLGRGLGARRERCPAAEAGKTGAVFGAGRC